jgi:hypothetical protein
MVSLQSYPTVIGYTRKARLSDIRVVADNMRAEDVAEVKAHSGALPDQALLASYLHSQPCMSIVSRHGNVIGMWGVVPQGDKVGRIWMLGTQAMFDDEKDRRTFLRQSKEMIRELHHQFTLLFNEVDARNKVHVRWLRWMGFTFVRYRPNYGVEGRPFYEFCRVSHV